MSLPPQQDPYRALGISKDADLATVKKAYRQLVLKCHPDKFQDPTLKAQKVDEFHKVQSAYDMLSDDRKRAEYDDKIKLQELRREMGRGTAPSMPQRSNTFDFDILRNANVRTAEYRPPNPSSSEKVYSRTPPRSHEDDVRASSFDEPSRTRARKAPGYDERKRTTTKEDERSRRADDYREAERHEKEARKAKQDADKKSRGKERRRDTEEKFSRVYVDDFEDNYRSKAERKSSYDEDVRRDKPREKLRREESAPYVVKMSSATDYIHQSRAGAAPRPGNLPRAQTFHDSTTSSRYVPSPLSPSSFEDDEVRRSSASRSRRSSDQIPSRSREEPRSSERRSSPYGSDPYVVHASPPSSPTGTSFPKMPSLQTRSSAPPVIPSTSRKEAHRSKTMPSEYSKKESPPLSRSATYTFPDRTKTSSRGSGLKNQTYVEDDSDSDVPRYRSSPTRDSPPRRREPEVSTYRIDKNGHVVPVDRHRPTARDEYPSTHDRSESPGGTSVRRSAKRPPLSRSGGSGSGNASYLRSDYSTEPPIIKTAAPSSRYFGEVNYSPIDYDSISFSQPSFGRRGSDPNVHQYAYPPSRETRVR